MPSVHTLTVHAAEPTTSAAFYRDALGLGPKIDVQGDADPGPGFRGFAISLLVAQPADVHLLLDRAVAAGATALKAAKASLWGYGAVLQAPDGTAVKIATSAKQDRGPASAQVDQVVLLLGAEDLAASKRCYVAHGFEVARSFPRTYAQFTATPDAITLALYRHRGLAKDVGFGAEPAAPHGLTVHSDVGGFTDPDGFEWRPGDRAGADSVEHLELDRA